MLLDVRIRVASIAALAAAAFGLIAPGVAGATIHTGRIVFPEPRNPPSIGVPPPPAVQAKESTHEIIIRYDASAGTISLRAEVFDPSFWGEQIGESFRLGSKCLSYNESVFHPPAFNASMSARPKRVGLLGEEVGGVTGEATLRGYTGHVNGTGRLTAATSRSRSPAVRFATGTGVAPCSHPSASLGRAFP